MSLFDPYPDVGRDDDKAVLCHEFGHAVAWFRFCGVVGSLKLTRQSNDEGIEGAILLSPRDGRMSTQMNDAHREPYTVRLLAGDVAYRKAMQMTEGRISLRGFCPDKEYSVKDILAKLERENRKHEDLYKIIKNAQDAAPRDTLPWLRTHLRHAIEVVSDHWTAIAVMARRSCAFVPREDQVVWIPGTTLITWMMNRGIEPGQEPPLEVIDWEDQPDRVIAIKRLCRRLCGKHGVLHVKEEA